MNIDKIVAASKGGNAISSQSGEEQSGENYPGTSATGNKKAAAQPQNQTPEQEVVNEGRIIASPLAKKTC